MWSEFGISRDTQRMLDTLIKSNNKLNNLKLRLRFVVTGSIFCMSLFGLAFMKLSLIPSGGDVLRIIGAFSGEKLLLALLLISITLVAYSNSLSKKVESTKKKYEGLRAEVIDKLYTSWLNNTSSEIRDRISKKMSDEYGINMVYKTKQ
ncbi:DUF2663 family protein [Paenibacillus albiflavus]|uniref:DUF2663 family protein n=1 Tax=Paenibacillus albiflavus TaxID=2545760 RepID=A0A4R4E2C5_9BACL|nr:DUF2663 family protein [Paenibacillus albiflavus]TCZ73027.1 DUF2663 family protein [Paenibacillus albiflavus]